ncbi:hypothetical protein KAR91_33250, partial [Candidatus Pacearchaeota archaeon]|nr:hypothetical protein [Candidatus Pacearchaeota archaeon]
TGLEKLTKMEMEGELSAGLKIADPRQMMIADGLAYIELYEGQLFRLEEAGYGTPDANEREEPLDDGIRRVVIPSGVVFTEAEVERHFSEEQYQGDEPQEEVVWEKVRTYLELS